MLANNVIYYSVKVKQKSWGISDGCFEMRLSLWFVWHFLPPHKGTNKNFPESPPFICIIFLGFESILKTLKLETHKFLDPISIMILVQHKISFRSIYNMTIFENFYFSLIWRHHDVITSDRWPYKKCTPA